ncbi:hypothetical protein DPX16_7909 [Anabarilius grahami]|uniref:Uncharacterized protein n=1 Tax=Anabarilius grahami TaxID=495550 RepID=A0A3N0Y7P0_ANAGA|nr:hypothetical protein DPX16_7909 [Anabarilius grahami]
MILAEDRLWSLRKNGRPSQRYVEDFLELSHQSPVASEAAPPWPLELPASPWTPESPVALEAPAPPVPQWSPKSPVPSEAPVPPEPPWITGPSVPSWLPELPTPPWFLVALVPPWRLPVLLKTLQASLQGAFPPTPIDFICREDAPSGRGK